MDSRRKENEPYLDYGYRLYKNKQLFDLSNKDIGDILNAEFDLTYDESAHRKRITSYIEGYDNGYETAVKEIPVKSSHIKSLAPKSHLDKMKELAGDYHIQKRNMELERLELAKLMREATPAILLAEQYKEHLEEYGIPIPEGIKFKATKVGTSVIKSLPSDLHVGVEVNEEYNTYNYRVAQDRMKRYTQSVIDYARMFNAHTISITTMGDLVESTELRGNQKFFVEFDYAEQVMKAQELIFNHVMDILNEGFKVDLSGVFGNHCRMTGNKNDNIDTSNATYLILENIKNTFKQMEKITGQKFENISFPQYDDTYKMHCDEYYGVRIRYQHGDDDSKTDGLKLEKYNGVDGDDYDGLVFGHLHHFRHIQLNRNQFELYCPCLQGANDYGKNRIKSTSDAGQAIIVIRDNGEVIPVNINLQ